MSPRVPQDGQATLPRDHFQWTWEPIAYWAERRGSATAVTDPAHQLSYAELWAEVERWVAALRARGLRPGDRLLILCENCCATVLATYAAQRLMAWAIPLNARLSAREVDAIAAHSGARLVVSTDAVSPDAAAHAKRLGAEAVSPFKAFGASLAQGPTPQSPEPVVDDPKRQVAAMIYTSGTTGEPKGVMLSHDNLMFVAGRTSEARWVTYADHVYAVLPTSHVFGLASMLCGTLYQGARLRFAPRFDGAKVLQALAEEEITIFQGVPQMHARLCALIEASGHQVRAPKLRYMSSGGAPLDPALKERVEAHFGLSLINGYGITEAAATVTITPIDSHTPDISSGATIDGVSLRIVSPEGNEAAVEEVGEIWVKGRLLMPGYYRDPEATAAVLTSDGWFKTGDLGRLDARGYLWVVGRLKELIIRSGFNVYPPEVEAVLAAHPDVTLAAVLGAPQADGNEEVVAFLQPKPGRNLDLEEVRTFTKERLAPYKRPGRYEVMAELPAAATGKLLKHKLRAFL